MLEHLAAILTTALVALHWVIIVVLGLRILLNRRPRGVALAWLLLITTLPFVGAVLYVLVGELWLPRRRIRIAQNARVGLEPIIRDIEDNWELPDEQLPDLARALNAQLHTPFGLSALGGNAIELLGSADEALPRIVEEIDQAQECVNMLFYIWQSRGQVCDVEDALLRAVQRGVQCRVLLDGAGSRKFLKSKRVHELRKAGIEVVEALPIGFMRFLFRRVDIRNHRKVIVVDHRVAFTGSMNMVDPAHFKAGRGVGEWIDVMVRVAGPAARALDLHLLTDWSIEAGEQDQAVKELIELRKEQAVAEPVGDAPAQVVPSGPDQRPELIHEMLVTLIYNTKRRLVITTPYFVPSEPMLNAIIGAAHRGVRVSLVMPARVDSIMVRHASRAYFQDLLEAGVEVYAYKGGLLHSKTVSADQDVGLIGSVNMDLRSFSINFEMSLFVYHPDLIEQLRALQGAYIEDSVRIELDYWKRRPVYRRAFEHLLHLLSPIL